MIRKLGSGEYRLYSRKVNPQNRQAPQPRHLQVAGGRAEKHERAVQYFKRH